MAQNTTLTLDAGVWGEITNSDVTNVTFQNLSHYPIYVQATTGSAPTTEDGSVEYGPTEGERNVALTDLFPGVTDAVRVWVTSEGEATVFVSHA